LEQGLEAGDGVGPDYGGDPLLPFGERPRDRPSVLVLEFDDGMARVDDVRIQVLVDESSEHRLDRIPAVLDLGDLASLLGVSDGHRSRIDPDRHQGQKQRGDDHEREERSIDAGQSGDHHDDRQPRINR
jgi:hypothetical protein